ncbi:uncharacterized protein LOC143106181 [Alosa pseudoharengus]|uniref:uncharacterized protein LOC143106181 n=1 Tax=Alosa pseudoharengus TaxID=34774 RepID=UPI003F8A5BC2
MEKWKEEGRAEERKMKVKKQREFLRSAAGGVPHISDMGIVLLGNRVAGRSSSGNTILGREEFSTSGRTAECVKREGQTAGRHITVVEAPGWWKNSTVEQTPERDKREMVAGNRGFHFQRSMPFPPNLKENKPADGSVGSSGYHSAETKPQLSKLRKPSQSVTTAASTQNSGYGTDESRERTESSEVVKKIPQARPNGGGQAAPQDLHKPKHKETPATNKDCLEIKSPFVDGNTITVNPESIGQGSYGKVYRGSYQ